MEWDIDEPKKKNSGDITSKILIGIMIFLFIVIVVIIALIYTLKSNIFILQIDGESKKYSEKLIKTESNTTYINIQELAGLLKYEYHTGEYKVYSSDLNKCYIKSNEETASYYLNSDRVSKLKTDDITGDYENFLCSNNIIGINNEFYAPIDAIEIGFNVSITITEKKMSITTLGNLVSNTDKKINKNADEPAFTSLSDIPFDNKKALLYGFIITSKVNSGLYSVTSLQTGKEIIPDKYTDIKFIESTKEFLVTNNLNKIGIIDENGQNKIEQLYDSISVINSNPKLYLVKLNEKFGVIDENGNIIIHNEYDKIGMEDSENKYAELKNQYVLLDKAIPVSKNGKYGLIDITGNILLDIKYDGIGYPNNTAELNEITKSVTPLVYIEDFNGIVIKYIINNEEKYDLFLADTKELISLHVSSIYSIKENGKINYYMVYNGKELKLKEQLVKLGYIKEKDVSENNKNNNAIQEFNTTTQNNIINTTH